MTEDDKNISQDGIWVQGSFGRFQTSSSETHYQHCQTISSPDPELSFVEEALKRARRDMHTVNGSLTVLHNFLSRFKF